MRNQFFYTIVQDDPKADQVRGSFGLDRVVRTMEYGKGKLMCLLDDMHTEQRKMPVPGKNGKVNMVTQNVSVASEIFLNEEDTARYIELTSV